MTMTERDSTKVLEYYGGRIFPGMINFPFDW